MKKIHLIGPVGIRGMSFWLDVGSVVVQNVEDKVRLVLVRANDSCIAWHVIGYQGSAERWKDQEAVLREVGDEPQQVGNANAWQLTVERTVDCSLVMPRPTHWGFACRSRMRTLPSASGCWPSLRHFPSR
jgi:hypothetical protein